MPSTIEHIKATQEKRNKIVVQYRTVLDTAEAEKRELTKEEDERLSKMSTDIEAMGKRLDELAKCRDAEEDERADDEDEEDEKDDSDEDEDTERLNVRLPANAVKRRKDKGQRRNGPRTPPGGGDPRGGDGAQLKRHPWETPAEYRTRQRRSSPEYREVFNFWLRDGDDVLKTSLAQRAIQADSDIVGGYLVAPQEFTGQLIKFVDNEVWIRQYATKYTVAAAQSLGAPSLDQDIADADWTSELDTGNEDTSFQFGKRELTPRPLAKRVKISNKLLRLAKITGGASADGSVSGGGPEGLVRSRLGYKFAVTEEKAFLLGNGANQPLGIFIASSRGVDTTRDVVTGSSTGFTADGIIAAKYAIKYQYLKRCWWMFHRTCLQSIQQLKDGNGQYLWVPSGMGSVAGFSDGGNSRTSFGDRLLGIPIMMSEYAPNTQTTGLYVGALFDPSFYWIADSETMQIQRLVELYAAANQTGFIARQELDGMPVLAEAYVRLKCN